MSARESVNAADIILFMEEEIICKHGLPEQVVSDNGPQFVSTAFANVAKLMGFKHARRTDYYPEANGMDERLNGSLVKIMRNYINPDQLDWDKHIKWSLFVYNTARNESTKLSSYNV